MDRSANDSFWVVEVAPEIFLVAYSQGGCYVADKDIYSKPIEKSPLLKHSEFKTISDYDLKRAVARFHSKKEISDYINKQGSMEDFFSWCESLKERFGGDGKPKVCKVEATISVKVKERKNL